MFSGEHGGPCCDASDDGNARGFGQSNAAGSAGNDFDSAFSLQRAKVIFSRVGRLEAQLAGNVCPSRGVPRVRDILSNHVENLFLSCGQFHDALSRM